MTPLVSQITLILSLGTIGCQVIIAVLLAALLFGKNSAFLKFVWAYALELAFLVALVSSVSSMFYSLVANFEPCDLCWYQRIFMFPQVVLFGLALLKKDKRIFDYSIALSIVGFLIAGYQYLLQWGVVSAAPCAAVGISISCLKLYFIEFGYVTIPLMSATVFALLILLGLIGKKRIESG